MSPYASRWAFFVLHAFYLKLNDTQSLACPSPFESHDVPCLSIGLLCILPFESVSELFLSDFFISDFSGEACTFTFSVAKLVQGRILQVPGALFPEFFQKLFPSVPANKNFSWPQG